MPNAFLEHDPKPVLNKLALYSQEKQMTFQYKKNSHKLKFLVPMRSEGKYISFWIIFEKGRKKSTKGLYRLKFKIETDDIHNQPNQDHDYNDFLCEGFLKLVKDFAQ